MRAVRAAGVIARFLSLLDVTLILLGVLMLTLAQASLNKPPPPTDVGDKVKEKDKRLQSSNVNFIYVFVGGQAAEKGKLYLLKPDLKRGQEVSETNPQDIEAVKKLNKDTKKNGNQVVMLLFDDNSFHSDWPSERIDKLKKTWKTDIISIYEFKLEGKITP